MQSLFINILYIADHMKNLHLTLSISPFMRSENILVLHIKVSIWLHLARTDLRGQYQVGANGHAKNLWTDTHKCWHGKEKSLNTLVGDSITSLADIKPTEADFSYKLIQGKDNCHNNPIADVFCWANMIKIFFRKKSQFSFSGFWRELSTK